MFTNHQTAAAAEQPSRTKAAGSGGILRGCIYAGLGIWALFVLFPFYWMLLTSVKSYGSYNAERVPALLPVSRPSKTMPMHSPQYRLPIIF